MALAFVLYGITYLLGRLPWQLFQPLQMDLLKPQLLPWFTAPSPATRSTPWLFIYSKRDEIVPHDQVQRFVKNVEATGFKTIQDVYEDTPHVSHMPSDPTRYWTTILCIWKAHATP
jgi:predicted esterase